MPALASFWYRYLDGLARGHTEPLQIKLLEEFTGVWRGRCAVGCVRPTRSACCSASDWLTWSLISESHERDSRGDWTFASPPTAGRMDRRRSPPGGAHLTARQVEVLRLVERGRSNKAIAKTLDLSMSTVKTHLRTIFSLLEARSRTEAVAKGRDLGWL